MHRFHEFRLQPIIIARFIAIAGVTLQNTKCCDNANKLQFSISSLIHTNGFPATQRDATRPVADKDCEVTSYTVRCKQRAPVGLRTRDSVSTVSFCLMQRNAFGQYVRRCLLPVLLQQRVAAAADAVYSRTATARWLRRPPANKATLRNQSNLTSTICLADAFHCGRARPIKQSVRDVTKRPNRLSQTCSLRAQML